MLQDGSIARDLCDLPPEVLTRWADIAVATAEIEQIKFAVSSGNMPQEDGYQDGRPYLGARSIIRNIMLHAGLSKPLPGCTEFGVFWRQYQRVKAKPNINPLEVIGIKADGTAETMLDSWVAYDLKPRLKAVIEYLRSHGSNRTSDLRSSGPDRRAILRCGSSEAGQTCADR